MPQKVQSDLLGLLIIIGRILSKKVLVFRRRRCLNNRTLVTTDAWNL